MEKRYQHKGTEVQRLKNKRRDEEKANKPAPGQGASPGKKKKKKRKRDLSVEISDQLKGDIAISGKMGVHGP